jgi:hypothetical protein
MFSSLRCQREGKELKILFSQQINAQRQARRTFTSINFPATKFAQSNKSVLRRTKQKSNGCCCVHTAALAAQKNEQYGNWGTKSSCSPIIEELAKKISLRHHSPVNDFSHLNTSRLLDIINR